MASYDAELLEVANRLITRRAGQKGKLSSAKIRRSISTSYYALFHFLLNDMAFKVVGSGSALSKRRRILARTVTHRGVKTTLGKIAGDTIESSISSFVNAPNDLIPRFARNLARAFADAQAKRHDADYDMNKTLSELDARLLHTRVRDVIANWRNATSKEDRDFKHAVSVLILLKGQLRVEE